MLRAIFRRGLAQIRRFVADRDGGVLAEFGILMPVLTIIVLSGIEVGRFTLLQQKLSRVAVSMSDLIAQTDGTISVTQVANLYEAAGFVVRPFELADDGVIIVSSVSQTGGTPSVNWQCIGAGTLSATSQLGTSGGTATLPAGFTMRDGESAIIAEVVYDYEPFVAPDVVGNKILRHRAMFRPRFGALTALAPGTVPAGAPTCT
jgi:Flp pilus assembly pilin Flp